MKQKRIKFLCRIDDDIRESEARVCIGEATPHLLRNRKDRRRAYYLPFFGDIDIKDVTTPKLREFVYWLSVEKGLKYSSILAILSQGSVVLRKAYEDGIIDRMPHIPRKGQKPAPRPAFTRTGYLRLLQILKDVEKGAPVIAFHGNKVDWELRAIATFMVNSFFRPGDIFKVQNKHVTIVPKDAEGPAYLRIDLPSSKGHHAPIITMPVAVPIYERTVANHRAAGFGKPNDYVFLPSRQNRAYAHEIVRRQFRLVLIHADLLKSSKGVDHTLYSLRHSALTFRLLNAQELDLVTLARAARTSVDMIDRYYASTLTAEMNRDKLHSFRRPTRFLTDGKGG